MHIPIFGNGDVDSPESKREKDKYGVDGIMIVEELLVSIFNEINT